MNSSSSGFLRVTLKVVTVTGGSGPREDRRRPDPLWDTPCVRGKPCDSCRGRELGSPRAPANLSLNTTMRSSSELRRSVKRSRSIDSGVLGGGRARKRAGDGRRALESCRPRAVACRNVAGDSDRHAVGHPAPPDIPHVQVERLTQLSCSSSAMFRNDMLPWKRRSCVLFLVCFHTTTSDQTVCLFFPPEQRLAVLQHPWSTSPATSASPSPN